MSTQSPGQQLIGIAQTIGHGFANLLNFRGRDSASQFWPYALAVVVVVSFASAFAMDAPMRAMMQVMSDYIGAHPDQGSIQVGTNGTSVSVQGFPPELTGVMSSMIPPIIGIGIATLVLLASAVVRRLRDRNRSLIWAVIPAVFAVIAFGLFPLLFTSAEPNGWVFFVLFANNVLYIVFLIRLIVLLVGPSVPSGEVTS